MHYALLKNVKFWIAAQDSLNFPILGPKMLFILRHSGSEICAETPVASGLITNQTTKCRNYANPSQLTGCQIKRQWTLALLSKPATIHWGMLVTLLPTGKDKSGTETTRVSYL